MTQKNNLANRIEELEEQNRLLQQVNKNLEDFVYAAAHDFRSPLRTILGFTDVLLSDDGLSEQQQEHLRFIHDDAERLSKLIDDLLVYSRIKDEVMETVDSNEVVSTIIRSLAAQIAEKGAEIVLDPLPVVQANKTQLSRIFQNLIDNAVKFSPAGETITISCHEQTDEYRFSISDQGIGIEQEYLQKIFAIFQRLHRSEDYEGTGVGLAICQKIVHQHGGQIWVESKPGVGSTFYFTIPKGENLEAS